MPIGFAPGLLARSWLTDFIRERLIIPLQAHIVGIHQVPAALFMHLFTIGDRP